MDTKKIVDETSKVLVLVGALNWGLVGVAKFNLVEKLLGTMPLAVTAVYVLVGASAVYTAYNMYK